MIDPAITVFILLMVFTIVMQDFCPRLFNFSTNQFMMEWSYGFIRIFSILFPKAA